MCMEDPSALRWFTVILVLKRPSSNINRALDDFSGAISNILPKGACLLGKWKFLDASRIIFHGLVFCEQIAFLQTIDFKRLAMPSGGFGVPPLVEFSEVGFRAYRSVQELEEENQLIRAEKKRLEDELQKVREEARQDRERYSKDLKEQHEQFSKDLKERHEQFSKDMEKFLATNKYYFEKNEEQSLELGMLRERVRAKSQ